jgi:hypothetical protein
VSAPNVDEAAAVRDHVPELIGPVESSGQGTRTARAEPADHPARRVIGEIHLLADNWKQLVDQEPRVVAVDPSG